MALLGAVVGYFFLGLFAVSETEAALGRLVGSGAGAFLGTLLAVYLAQKNRVRKWILAGVGGLAFFDALGAIFSGALLPSFLSLGKSSLLKRLLFYGGAIAVLILVKGKKVYDQKSYQEAVAAKTGDYLAGAIPLILVLMFRLKDGRLGFDADQKSRSNEELPEEVAYIVSRMLGKPELAREPLFTQLLRKLEKAGFEFPAVNDSQIAITAAGPRAQLGSGSRGPRKLAWEASLVDRYEPFGFIEDGRMVIIEEEPVYKNGKVVRKGQAVPE
jgi:pimeloyl-ACP methyl ester carboxylesterase